MAVSVSEVIGLLLKVMFYYMEALYRLIVPPPRRDISGKIVLVTGAGHGIGREFSLEFARLGARLVLFDINKESNEKVAKEVRQLGVQANTYVCDVSSSDDIRNVSDKVKREVGKVDVLVNNAGILYGGPLLEMEEKHIRRTFEVNTLAHFWLVRAFLPAMIEDKSGIIMNISSGTAKTGTAFLVDYSSSKSAVFGFTDALEEELDALGHTGVQTTVVLPYFVNTGLCKMPRSRFDPLLTPKETALAAIDGMLRGYTIVYVPPKLSVSVRMGALMPRKVGKMLKKFSDIGIDPQYKVPTDSKK